MSMSKDSKNNKMCVCVCVCVCYKQKNNIMQIWND